MRTPIDRLALLTSCLLVVAACGDDTSTATGGGGGAAGATASASSSSSSSVGPSSSSASSGQGAGGPGGAGGEGGIGDGGLGGQGGGGGADFPTDCDGLHQAMVDWLAEHQACRGEGACQRLDDVVPIDSGICDPIAAPGDDLDQLEAFAAAWDELECETDGICGFTPGDAVCGGGGTCELTIDDDCETCPTELEPVCTENGENAVNGCFAAECLSARSWEPGYCPDSAGCTAAGGTCEESFFTADPPCADGLRWNPDGFAKGCAGGNLRNECCIPWDEPCSFVASSNTLSLDPFTCAPPTGDGQPWTCLHANQQTTCSLDGVIEQPLGDTYDADVVVTPGLGSTVHVEGVHADGSSFSCDGVLSFAFDVISTWSCEACDAEGDCVTCEIDQHALCAL